MRRITFGLFVFAVILLPLFSYADEHAKKRILYIGDSITDGGWGNSGGSAKPSEQRNHWDKNHIFGHSFMMISAATIMADFPGEYECFNRGISGNTLADLEKRWTNDCINLHPDVISILIGTNDVDICLKDSTQSFDVKSWERRFDGLMQSTKEQLPKVRIMLCTPFVAKTGKVGKSENYAKREGYIKECVAVVERLAMKYNATLVPFAQLIDELTLADNGNSTEMAAYWIWDGIHPTPACHKKMADLWLKKFLSKGND